MEKPSLKELFRQFKRKEFIVFVCSFAIANIVLLGEMCLDYYPPLAHFVFLGCFFILIMALGIFFYKAWFNQDKI
jgi:hypothetical protein